jgi:hypothetical protein
MLYLELMCRHFPARKINNVETNKTKSDFSEGGLKYADMGSDG